MKKKPMLYNGLKKKDRLREIIGVVGTHRGAGATHTCLMLSFYMGEERGKKTALIEYNKHRDMDRMQTAYLWSNEDGSSFSFHQITCFKEVSKQSLTPIFNKNFGCFILDFGADIWNNLDEFFRCGTKIVVGSQAEWNQRKLLKFSQAIENIDGKENWLYLIPYANRKVIASLRSELGEAVYGVPFEPNPIMLTRDSLKLFDSLFLKGI